MEVPDEETVLPGAGEDGVGGSKDLLYGWLVGRAAADLGLAQALALSEAQRVEQIKRLEESLLGHIRELQKRDASGGVKSSTELDGFKVELQRVSERQQQLASDRVHVEQLEAAIRGKLSEFENHIQQRPREGAGSDLSDIKLELKLLVDRIARAEFSVQQAQAHAESQSQQVGEIVTDRLKTETAFLKTQLVDELANDTFTAKIAHSVETSLQEQLAELRAELEQGARAANALGALQDRLAKFSQRLDQIESALGANLADHDNQWRQELDARMDRLEQTALGGTADLQTEIGAIKTRLDEAIAAVPAEDPAVRQLGESVSFRIGELQERLADALSASQRRDAEMGGFDDRLSTLKGQLSEFAKRADEYATRMGALEKGLSESRELGEKGIADLGQLQCDMNALLNRITQLELSSQQAQRAQQAADGLRVDVAELKADLGQQTIVTIQSILANVEETFGAKLNELQSCMARSQQDSQGHGTRLSEMQGEIQRIASRLVQTESGTQQIHALMVNEAAQSAQLREGVMSEVTELRGELAAQQASGKRLDDLGEALSARIDNLQSQLSRSVATLESRDAEIAELKTQLQFLCQSANLKSVPPAPAGHPPPTPIGVKASTESRVQRPPAAPGDLKSLLRSYEAEIEVSNDEKKQLQQRISADIERARAELRKRAGVSR